MGLSMSILKKLLYSALGFSIVISTALAIEVTNLKATEEQCAVIRSFSAELKRINAVEKEVNDFLSYVIESSHDNKQLLLDVVEIIQKNLPIDEVLVRLVVLKKSDEIARQTDSDYSHTKELNEAVLKISQTFLQYAS